MRTRARSPCSVSKLSRDGITVRVSSAPLDSNMIVVSAISIAWMKRLLSDPPLKPYQGYLLRYGHTALKRNSCDYAERKAQNVFQLTHIRDILVNHYMSSTWGLYFIHLEQSSGAYNLPGDANHARASVTNA